MSKVPETLKFLNYITTTTKCKLGQKEKVPNIVKILRNLQNGTLNNKLSNA